MSGVVVFDPNKFLNRYPEMHSNINQMSFTWFAEAENKHAILQGWFEQAEILVNNTECSVVKNLSER